MRWFLAPFILIPDFIIVFLIFLISLINNEMRSEMAMKLFSHWHWFTHHHLRGGGVKLVGHGGDGWGWWWWWCPS